MIAIENELAGDTTHYHAFSGFETVTYEDEKGKEKKKSQSKLTENCRCQDPVNCPHPYQLADDGAGTIVKGGKKYIWGHKASVLGFPAQGIPLDATAVADAATFDGATLYPHVAKALNLQSPTYITSSLPRYSFIRLMSGLYNPSSAFSPETTSDAKGIPRGSRAPDIIQICGRCGSSLLTPL